MGHSYHQAVAVDLIAVGFEMFPGIQKIDFVFVVVNLYLDLPVSDSLQPHTTHKLGLSKG